MAVMEHKKPSTNEITAFAKHPKKTLIFGRLSWD